MPLYKYKVINDDGKKIQGTFNTNSKNEVLAMIKENNYYPIEVSESMEKQNKIFPYLFTNIVQAGEVSGKLHTIMLRMTEHYEKENKINRKIKAIWYIM